MSLRGFIYKLQFMSWAVPGPGAAECGLLFPHHAPAGGRGVGEAVPGARAAGRGAGRGG
jgi:hypothetical protein